MTRAGRSIELYFVDGDPGGMVTATIPFQWTGHVLVSSRTQIKEALARFEAGRPGVYLLVGDKDGEPFLYVGETDEIKTRITAHAAQKDWWSTAILITSSGEPLNKAHARYLESRLHAGASRLRKISLDNSQSPTPSPLSEAAKAHMDDFLENIYLVLPALRFDFLTEDTKPDSPTSAEPVIDAPVYFTLTVPRHGVKAEARVEGGQFVVEAGSIAQKEWIGTTSSDSTYAKLFGELVSQGILVPKGKNSTFARSYVFKSPSAAAAVVAGRPTSGPTHWKLKGTKKSYGEWEADNLALLIGDIDIDL
ncbi:GIY-YIG nuclease family protein [Ruegeria hyattellae]|uniref:GIY-YIG nuclease family protein n=1 Tax=Ruegeria hyattellae TaxID=3233337 RepID=UPI00355C3B0C